MEIDRVWVEGTRSLDAVVGHSWQGFFFSERTLPVSTNTSFGCLGFNKNPIENHFPALFLKPHKTGLQLRLGTLKHTNLRQTKLRVFFML